MKWCPRFFAPYFSIREDRLVKVMQRFLLCPHRTRILRRVRMVFSKPLCCRSASLQRLSHRSPFYLRLLERPACSLHVTRCVSSQSCRPLQHYPHNYQQSASTVVLPPGKNSMENRSHQQLGSTGENECRSFESAKNAEENKPAPTKRERVRERVGEA